jgi:hypothetical protein
MSRPGKRAAPPRAAHAFTVLELLIALSLMAIVISASGAAFSATFKAWIAGRKLADEQQNARLVLEWMGRRIRLAGVGTLPPNQANYFVEAAAGSAAFFADVNGDGIAEVHRFCLDTAAGVVREQVVALPPAPPTCTAGSPITSRGIKPLRIAALGLAYFNGIEQALPPPVTTAELLAQIKRVEILLALDSNQSGAYESGSDVTFRMNAIVRNY